MQLRDAKILVIDDDEDVLTALRLLLKPQVKEVIVEKNPNALQRILELQDFDVVILDMTFNGLVNTGNEGIFWLNKIKLWKPATSVILITAYGNIDLAIRSLKEGASDFLVKPWKNEKLLESVAEILNKKKTVKSGKIKLNTETKIVGDSEAMQEVFMKLKKVAPTDANILILGENGTGKDLIARSIHENSLRKNKPFVKVDVGSLTATLFESELFGYKKGAFTDAREDRKGRFEAAHGGTLFLDEIGNISLRQQARLLTILQNRQVTPLGANESIPVDIRLICATNLRVSDLADESKFRKDLIYRIHTVDLMIPPLRERREDIPELARHFLAQAPDEGLPLRTLSPDGAKLLSAHDWPGNVRELRNTMLRAALLAREEEIEVATLRPIVGEPKAGGTAGTGETSFAAAIGAWLEREGPPEGALYHRALAAFEVPLFEHALRSTNGNQLQAAKLLGINRNTLRKRIVDLGIDADRFA